MTTVTYPGETTWEINLRRLNALLGPYIGLMFALRKIQWFLILEKDPLKRACRGEVLCQVVRTKEWVPVEGTTVFARLTGYENYQTDAALTHSPVTLLCHLRFLQQTQSGPAPVMVTKEKKLHLVQGLSLSTLPKGYGILRCQGIPALRIKDLHSKTNIHSDHRMIESTLGLLQIMFATISLYRARGGQFERFGVAAFSFTVLPFAVMSFANLIASLVSINYPYLYLVESPEMEEAMKRDAIFDNTVGRLEIKDYQDQNLEKISFERIDGVLKLYRFIGETKIYLGDTMSEALSMSTNKKTDEGKIIIDVEIPSHVLAEEERPTNSIRSQLWDKLGLIIAVPVGLILFITPSIIVWAFSRYQPAQSSLMERIGLLTWFYAQQFSLLFLLAWNYTFQVDTALQAPERYSKVLEHGLGWTLRAIGLWGYVLVVLQILEFGVCVEV
ncbi:hypothetical protein MMC17_008554 [Xylographa soralifera]|nr:hypothetical protein [Xylographa soralifera]